MALRRIAQGVLILKPKQPMLDWLDSLPAREGEGSTDRIKSDAIAVLIPCLETEAQLLQLLDRNMDRFFEQALLAWSLDLTAWPKKRDLRSFREMFDMEVCPHLYDLGQHFRDTATSEENT